MTTSFPSFQNPEQARNFECSKEQTNTPLINFDVIKKLTIMGSSLGQNNNNYKIKKYQKELNNIKTLISKPNDRQNIVTTNYNEKINNLFNNLNKTCSMLNERQKNNKTNLNDSSQLQLKNNNIHNNNDYINKVWNYLGNKKSIKLDFKIKNNHNNDQNIQVQHNILLNSNNINLHNINNKNIFNNNRVIHSTEISKQSKIYKNKIEGQPLTYTAYQKQSENMQFVNHFEHKNNNNEYPKKQMINNIFHIIPHVFNQNNDINTYYSNHSSNTLNRIYFQSQHRIKLKINTSASLLGKKIDRFNNSSNISPDKKIQTNKLMCTELHQS